MNKFIATMAAVSTIALAAPAVAQPGYQQQDSYRGGNADANLSARIGQLQMRLQAGVQNGSISRREAMPLRQQLRQLTQLERQFSANGISGQERGELQRRMRDLRQGIRRADGNDQASWDNYDREDGYGQYEGRGRDDRGYGGYAGGDRIDANRDGYDDRDHDRDGRWDDDVNDGRYQPQQQQPSRGGLGGIVDSLLGRDTVRVGQRAPGNLYVLQGGYRDQFRDNDGSYFRTDGRQIYQIDARTQMVVRVYPMNR
jgi:hypothetical protein